MVKGISLNIGLNSVDPKHYGGWDGKLAGCESDANAMAEIVKSKKDLESRLKQMESPEEWTELILNLADSSYQNV